MCYPTDVGSGLGNATPRQAPDTERQQPGRVHTVAGESNPATRGEPNGPPFSCPKPDPTLPRILCDPPGARRPPNAAPPPDPATPSPGPAAAGTPPARLAGRPREGADKGYPPHAPPRFERMTLRACSSEFLLKELFQFRHFPLASIRNTCYICTYGTEVTSVTVVHFESQVGSGAFGSWVEV